MIPLHLTYVMLYEAVTVDVAGAPRIKNLSSMVAWTNRPTFPAWQTDRQSQSYGRFFSSLTSTGLLESVGTSTAPVKAT